MLRKLNFTDRLKIPRSRVRIALRRESDGMLAFDPEIDLSDLPVPGAAQVFIEAYYRTSYMRFDCGTAGRLAIPSDRRLSEIDSQRLVRFRVKIVDNREGQHRIIAVADDLAVAEQEPDRGGRIPLLPVNFSDLGDEIWRVVFEPNGPVLEMNNRVEGIELLARSDGRFFALVYPAAVRIVLTQILLVDQHEPGEELDDWWSLWLRWAAQFAATVPAGDEEDRRQWIEDVVAGFSARHAVLRKMNEPPPGARQ
ncbi:MAG TPA: hypothetical protein VEZ11_12725 [Thermoanaerobaculia bacterium]|nr:hypothetical protein [Thermoanaerobaculia bacterium]